MFIPIHPVVIQLLSRLVGLVATLLRYTRVRWSWFAGVRASTLSRAESDRQFYEVLGFVVFALSCVGGFAAAVAVGFMVNQPATSVWWVGVAWAVLLSCGIERLVMQVNRSQRLLVPAVVAQRLLLSALLAFAIGEPIMLMINQHDIDDYLSRQQRTSLVHIRLSANLTYDPQITAAKADISRLRRNEARVKSSIARYRRVSACDSALCRHYAQRAVQRSGDLMALKRRHAGRVTGLNAKMAELRKAKREEIADRSRAVRNDRGLIAREEALAAIMKGSEQAQYNVYFFRLLFFIIDLLPLGAKVLHVLSGSKYEQAMEVEQQLDDLGLQGDQLRAEVEGHRLRVQADVDKQVNETIIRLEGERRIRDAVRAHRSWASMRWSRKRRPNDRPVA